MRILMASVVVALAAGSARAQEKPAEAPRRSIDVVFCIDRSGSMSGVIATAKQKIWGIVNEIARARPLPRVRIGLIGYGSADQDIKLFKLTDDLDQVYQDLMTFQTDMGGDEWVGWALMKAHKEMPWSTEKNALKVIFMVGNETARQGHPEVMFDKTAPEAVKDGILVNTIYCGTPSAEEEKSWREVSALADGKYAVIDLSGGAVTIESPFDKELAGFNEQINATYVPYGAKGSEGQQKQQAQDANSNANGGSSNMAQRAWQKCNGTYCNDQWDLVDACRGKDFKLESVKDEELPEAMRKMTIEERKAYVARKTAERDELQKKVKEVYEKQRAFVDSEMKKRNLTADSAFDEAVRKTVREQAEKKEFKFEDASASK